MDGPPLLARQIPPLVRVSQATRHKTLWMALAYERLYPRSGLRAGLISSVPGAKGRRGDDGTPPREAAAGG